MDLPIVCTLSDAELRERRRTVLDAARAEAVETVPLPNGYSFKFAPKPDILMKLAHLVALEHQCCRFLTFKIVVEAGDSMVVLEVTGPPQARELIADFLS